MQCCILNGCVARACEAFQVHMCRDHLQTSETSVQRLHHCRLRLIYIKLNQARGRRSMQVRSTWVTYHALLVGSGFDLLTRYSVSR